MDLTSERDPPSFPPATMETRHPPEGESPDFARGTVGQVFRPHPPGPVRARATSNVPRAWDSGISNTFPHVRLLQRTASLAVAFLGPVSLRDAIWKCVPVWLTKAFWIRSSDNHLGSVASGVAHWF